MQNLTTIVTGMLNGAAPTNSQLLNIGNAFFYRMTDDDALAMFGYGKASVTADDKAQVAVSRLRAYLKQYVIAAGIDAANDANAAAAAAAGNANASGL